MSASTQQNKSVTSQAPEVSGVEVKYPQCTKKYYLLEENGVVYAPKVTKLNYYNFDTAYCLDKWIAGIMAQLAKDAKAASGLFYVELTDLTNKTFAIDLNVIPFKFEVDHSTCELVYNGKCPYNLGSKVGLDFVIQLADQISKWVDQVYDAIYNQLENLAQFFEDIIDNINPTDVRALTDLCNVLGKIPHLDWFAPTVVQKCQSLQQQQAGGGTSGGTSGQTSQQGTSQQSGTSSGQAGGGTSGGTSGSGTSQQSGGTSSGGTSSSGGSSSSSSGKK